MRIVLERRVVVRLGRLLVYCVSVVICLIGLTEAQGDAGGPLLPLFFLAVTLGLFGAIMYEVQQGQREWQLRGKASADTADKENARPRPGAEDV